ncbi:MAG TPA: class I SAM-dependent methyltransferase [Pyrinomonadaceae bacterium]|jgi:SAM-dependent methyltransferase
MLKTFARRTLGPLARRVVNVSGMTNRANHLHDEFTDMRTALAQLSDACSEAGVLLPPPRHLQLRVVGVYAPDFLSSGGEAVDEFEAHAQSVGASLLSSPRVLDFGCGVGRILRALSLRRGGSAGLCGTDIDAEAIRWCQKNYARLAEFSVNPHEPPMSYADNSFDLVYSMSVFTHLPEEMQHAWLAELRRVTRPGGHLLLTYHGRDYLDRWPVTTAEKDGALGRGFGYLDLGPTDGLPDFYRTAYHSPDYIRREWGHHFEVLDVREPGLRHGQGVALVRR